MSEWLELASPVPARSRSPVTGELLQSSLRAKKILFPDHNIPWDSQISVSIVSPGREPWEIAKIRETHGESVRLDRSALAPNFS